MKSSYQSHPPTDKWERMADLVDQLGTVPSGQELQKQFKKLAILRWAVSNFVSLSLQYGGLFVSTLVAPINLLWFAAGTACGLVFMRGFRILPGIWLGSFLAYFLLKSGLTLAAGAATLYTLQAFFLVWFSWRYITETLVFYQRKTFFRFTLLTLVVTAIISAGLIWLRELIFHTPFWLLWPHEWLANFIGVLVFSLALITLDTYFPQIGELRRRKKTPLGLCYSLLFVTTILLLVNHSLPLLAGLSLFMMVIFFVAAKYYDWCGFIAALFLVGFCLGLGALFGAPLYHMDRDYLLIGQILFSLVIVVGGLWTIRSTRISLIVAMSHRQVIGLHNQLPWRLPADLQHFKKITWGKPIIMGRKTFESIGKPLPGRRNIVVSRNPNWHASGCETAVSLQSALALAGNVPEVFIIGGALLFAQAYLLADRLYVTEIDYDFPGDAFFPFNYSTGWQEISRQACSPDAKNLYPYCFRTLQRGSER